MCHKYHNTFFHVECCVSRIQECLSERDANMCVCEIQPNYLTTQSCRLCFLNSRVWVSDVDMKKKTYWLASRSRACFSSFQETSSTWEDGSEKSHQVEAFLKKFFLNQTSLSLSLSLFSKNLKRFDSYLFWDFLGDAKLAWRSQEKKGKKTGFDHLICNVMS